eukprot:7327426-Prymnesium_polylepis.1
MSPPQSGSKRRTHRRSLQCSVEMNAAVSRRAGTRKRSYAASTWGDALNASAQKHQKCSCSKHRKWLRTARAMRGQRVGDCPARARCGAMQGHSERVWAAGGAPQRLAECARR